MSAVISIIGGGNMITELKYSNTNTYLISGSNGSILFDTGWAGTFPALCKLLGDKGLRLQDISCLMISHFHPDHYGIAQEIADKGVKIVILDVQKDNIHEYDKVFIKEKNSAFIPIDDMAAEIIPIAQSREFLKGLGIDGEIIHTPGHSDDSISLWLDNEKALFVGDLNPLYELEMHKGTQIEQSWNMLLKLAPKKVFYGHAKSAELKKGLFRKEAAATDIYSLVKQITKLVDKGYSAEQIQDKTGADETFITDVSRMYVTHPNVSVQGILDRIEIKGR